MNGKSVEIPRDELEEKRGEILARLHAANLLQLVEDYWTLRAMRIMREKADLLNWAAEKVADGRFSICHDMAEEVRSARKLFAGQAGPVGGGTIPAKRLSAV